MHVLGFKKGSFDKANETAKEVIAELKALDEKRVILEDRLSRDCYCVALMVASMGYRHDYVMENFYLALRNAIVTSDNTDNFASYMTNELANKVKDQIRNEGRKNKQNFNIKKSDYEENMHSKFTLSLEQEISLDKYEYAQSELEL